MGRAEYLTRSVTLGKLGSRGVGDGNVPRRTLRSLPPPHHHQCRPPSHLRNAKLPGWPVSGQRGRSRGTAGRLHSSLHTADTLSNRQLAVGPMSGVWRHTEVPGWLAEHARGHAYTRTCVHTCKNASAHTQVHMHTQARTQRHTRAHTSTYTPIKTQ